MSIQGRAVFAVEMWSEKTFIHPLNNAEIYDVSLAHLANTLGEAKRWALQNLDYGGKPDMGNYFPWHFIIREVFIGEEDLYGDVLETVKPDYKKVEPIDTVEEFIKDISTLAQKYFKR